MLRHRKAFGQLDRLGDRVGRHKGRSALRDGGHQVALFPRARGFRLRVNHAGVDAAPGGGASRIGRSLSLRLSRRLRGLVGSGRRGTARALGHRTRGATVRARPTRLGGLLFGLDRRRRLRAAVTFGFGLGSGLDGRRGLLLFAVPLLKGLPDGRVGVAHGRGRGLFAVGRRHVGFRADLSLLHKALEGAERIVVLTHRKNQEASTPAAGSPGRPRRH